MCVFVLFLIANEEENSVFLRCLNFSCSQFMIHVILDCFIRIKTAFNWIEDKIKLKFSSVDAKTATFRE